MDRIEDHRTVWGRDSARWRWASTVTAALAAGIAGYLAFVSLVLGVPPAGCGAGSSCEDILSSSWAKLLGVPVSVPALGLYLVVIVLIHLPVRPRVLQLRAAAAAAIAGSVVWFVFLQAVILRAFCPYCMVDHGFGLITAVLLFVSSRKIRPWRGLLAGAGAAAFLILGLIVQPHRLTRLDMSSAGDTDRVTPVGRELAIQDGKLRLVAAAEPRFGSETARTAVILMFDYACPHCRRVHGFCRALADRSGDLLVIGLPVPLSAGCNRFVPHTEDRFRDSCELARLSLAVFFAAPSRWPEFDEWLFGAEEPRTAGQAREQAAAILGDALGKALADERVERMVQRNVSAFGAIPAADPAARRLPVTWSPGRSPIVGPFESAGSFVEWLNRMETPAQREASAKPSNP